MQTPPDLRGHFELMLEVDIAYIGWLMRNGTENQYLLEYESRSNTESNGAEADQTGPTSLL